MKAPLTVMIALLASVTCLVGCGGDSSGSTAPPAPGAQTGSPSAPSAAAEAAKSEGAREAGAGGGKGTPTAQSPAEERKREARERATYERKRYGAPSARSAPFAKYSGKAAKGAPGLHLAEFGEEAEGADLAETQAAIQGYLDATAGAEWERACGYLAAEARVQVEALESQGGQPSSCSLALPKFLSAFGKGAGQAGVHAPEGVASLRVQEGGRAGEGAGFALFHGSDGNDHWMAVKRQEGQWRVISLSPQSFG